MTQAQMEQDKAEFEQLRLQATMNISQPEAALVNYHRCDAVVGYLTDKLKALETEGEKQNEHVT